MSVKAMAIAWEADLPQREKFVLLAYADHADHEGNNVFPSVGLIAWKTGYEPRSIQRITKALIKRGIMIQIGTSKYQTKKYKINLDAIPMLSPYLRGDSLTPAKYGGDILSGGNTKNQDRGDILGEGVTNSASRGDTAMSPKSLTISLNQEEGATPSIIDAIQAITIFTQVTGMVIIPGRLDERQHATETICQLWQVQKATTEYLRPFYDAWLSRGYSKANPAWLDWAVAGEIPKNKKEKSASDEVFYEVHQ